MAQFDHFQTSEMGEVLVVRVTTRKLLDNDECQAFNHELASLTERNPVPSRVLVNFGEVDFMSSRVLGGFIKFDKKCKRNRILWRLSNVREELLETFRITLLDRVFKIDHDQNDALARFPTV